VAVVSERMIEGSGTSEQEWQQSHALDRILEMSFDQLLASSKRIVVLSPHPDDEVLGCGGLLGSAALDGVPVLIVAITDGEQCYPGNLAWTPDRLRAARTAELHRAVVALGLDQRSIVPLHIADGSVEAEIDTLVGVLHNLLLPSDLVLAPWEHDGHPDHEAAAEAAKLAAGRADCRLLQYPIWAWHWMDPRSADFLAVGARRLPLNPTTHRMKLDAIECFRTQTGHCMPEIADPVLPPHVIARFTRPFEVFIL
jgi:LmbE family N-acetylglucosaminyl deacetylase